MTTVKPGLYKHFKGDLYVVVAVVLNVEGETDREMVLYEKLGPASAVKQMFVRSVENFVEMVKRPEYEGQRFSPAREPEYELEPRFSHVGSTEVIGLGSHPGAVLLR